jgi:acyl carrier protein
MKRVSLDGQLRLIGWTPRRGQVVKAMAATLVPVCVFGCGAASVGPTRTRGQWEDKGVVQSDTAEPPQDIGAKVKRIVLTNIDELKVHIESANDIKPEAYLVEDLGADSAAIMGTVLSLEREFGIDIPDEDIPKLRTVQDIIDYVTRSAEVEKRR